MHLIAWLAVCAAASYLTRRRPLVCIVAIVVLWVAVPSVASGLVTGRSSGSLGFHPATWLALTTVAAQLSDRGRLVMSVVARRTHLFLLLGLVTGVAVLTTRLGRSGGGMVLLADQVIGPLCLFVLTLVAARAGFDVLRPLRTALLVLAALTAALAITQWVVGDVLVYEQAHSTHRWFTRAGFDRWMATTDHPLTLSLFLCVVTPLAVGVTRRWVQLSVLGLAAVAVVVTQSRVGLAVIAVVIVYVVVKADMRPAAKLAFGAFLATAAFLIYRSSVSEGIASRLADDTGSAQARAAAVDFFAGSWWEYALVGGGFTSSYGVAGDAGLETSLESSFLMYAVDMGGMFAVLYFGAQVVLVAQYVGRERVPGLLVAASLAVALPHTYSALAAGSLVGTLLWTILAMVVVATDDPPVDRGELVGAIPTPSSRVTSRPIRATSRVGPTPDPTPPTARPRW